jgi:hypothetical protein
MRRSLRRRLPRLDGHDNDLPALIAVKDLRSDMGELRETAEPVEFTQAPSAACGDAHQRGIEPEQPAGSPCARSALSDFYASFRMRA